MQGHVDVAVRSGLKTGKVRACDGRKLRVGAPTPKMAIDEAKKIRETVATRTEGAEPVGALREGSG